MCSVVGIYKNSLSPTCMYDYPFIRLYCETQNWTYIIAKPFMG